MFVTTEDQLLTDSGNFISLSKMEELLLVWHEQENAKCDYCHTPNQFRFTEVKINGTLLGEIRPNRPDGEIIDGVMFEQHHRNDFVLIGLKQFDGKITFPYSGMDYPLISIALGLDVIYHELGNAEWVKLMRSKKTGFFEFRVDFTGEKQRGVMVRNYVDGFTYPQLIGVLGQLELFIHQKNSQPEMGEQPDPNELPW